MLSAGEAHLSLGTQRFLLEIGHVGTISVTNIAD